MRVGPVRADHRRESRPLRAHRASGVAVAGVEQDVLGVRAPARRTAAAGTRSGRCPTCWAVHDRDYNAAKVILAAGRAERLNASHASGRDRERGSGGAPVRPSTRQAVGDEAGSTPASGVSRHGNPDIQSEEHVNYRVAVTRTPRGLDDDEALPVERHLKRLAGTATDQRARP